MFENILSSLSAIKIVYCPLILYNKPIEIDVNWDWNSFISSQNLTSNHNINLNYYVASPHLDALMFTLTKFQPHNKIKKGIKLFYCYIYLELSLWYNCYIKGRLEIKGRKWKNISLILDRMLRIILVVNSVVRNLYVAWGGGRV